MYIRTDFEITILASSDAKVPEKPLVPVYLFCQVQQVPLFLIGVMYRLPHMAMQDTDLFQHKRD